MAGDTIIVQQMPDGSLTERHAIEGQITTGEGNTLVMHPWSITQLWTDFQLRGVGIFRVEKIEPPQGHIVTGYHFEWSNGKIIQVIETARAPPPESLSRRQFFQIAAMNGLITQDEALAAVQHGAIPAQMDGFVNALPSDQQFAAKMLIAGASEFDRHHQLTEAFAHYLGMNDNQIDEMWHEGATL